MINAQFDLHVSHAKPLHAKYEITCFSCLAIVKLTLGCNKEIKVLQTTF